MTLSAVSQLNNDLWVHSDRGTRYINHKLAVKMREKVKKKSFFSRN